MSLSVVLPVFNAADVTWRALSHLFLFSDAKIILVDDGSTDSTFVFRPLLEKQGHRFLRHEQNRGPHTAWNTGVTEALNQGAETILVINNDILCGPDAFSDVEETAKQYGYGCCYQVDAPRPDPLWFFGTSQANPAPQPAMDGRCIKPNVSLGSFFALRRDVVEKVGLFDDSMRLTHADIDFAYRCADAGFHPHFTSSHVVYHAGSNTRARNLSPEQDFGQSSVDFQRFAEKWAHEPDTVAMHSPGPRGAEIRARLNRREQ